MAESDPDKVAKEGERATSLSQMSHLCTVKLLFSPDKSWESHKTQETNVFLKKRKDQWIRIFISNLHTNLFLCLSQSWKLED